MPAPESGQPTPTDVRARLRRPGDALPDASIGTVPILWHHAAPDGSPATADPIAILDEIARLGYEGTQLDDGLPEGAELRSLLARRDLGLAEVYAALPASPTGLGQDALAIGRERLRLLVEGTGDVLCVALDGSPDRDARAGRAGTDGTPQLSDAAWARAGRRPPHARRRDQRGRPPPGVPPACRHVRRDTGRGRAPRDTTDPGAVGICLDVGHYLVGGGDPVAALERLGERVTHVHLKDVDPVVLARLSEGALSGLGEAVDQRIFTELGAGMLD